ncbi:hypothetical protein SEA_ATUIN_211 [Arthrobacter phage Atuin]|nr:hypothetical protein SEA_ATUIN_10 [Arthrobacter phage Atuin]
MALDMQTVTEDVAAKVFNSMNASPLSSSYEDLTAIQKFHFKSSLLPLVTHVVPVIEEASKTDFENRVNHIINSGRADGQSDAEILMSIQLSAMLG